MRISTEQAGFLLAAISAFSFACKTILTKIAYLYGADPITILAVRMAFAGIIFAGILAFNLIKKRWSLKLTPLQWLWVLLLAAFGYYFSAVLDFRGLVYVDAYLGRMILFVYPTLVVVINSFISRTPIRGSTWLALIFCYGGIFLIMLPNIGQTQNNLWLGSALIFASALIYAGYLIGVDQLMKVIQPMRFTSIVMCIACLCGVGHLLLIKDWAELASVSAPVIINGAVMGLFSTVLPIYTLTAAISRIGASKAALVSMVGPILTSLLGMAVLDEKIGPLQIAGMFLVMAGVWRVGK